MAKPVTKPVISIDGQFNDWVSSEQIDYNDVPGYSLYAQEQGGSYDFALFAGQTIGAGTTFWLNTDLNTATGYQIFGFAGGADYNIMIGSDGTASLYTGAAGQTLVLANIPIAYSADHKSVEFAISASAIGNPAAIDTLYQVNGSSTVYGPSDYTSQPYVAFGNDSTAPTSSATRIAIVYSDTTAANYFSTQAYSDLIMSAENQAMEAGIPFDLISESDLTNLSKLANYSAIVFPSFADVQSSQVNAITNTLLQATRQFGIGLITSGDFMTNDQTGAVLSGDPYARMKLFFEATRVAGGNSDNITINSSDTNQTVFTKEAPGTQIASYTGIGWAAYQSLSSASTTIATETVNGQTYAAALATPTAGGRNVLFSSNAVMANNNLLGQAIDYVAKDPGLSVSLDMTRSKGILAARMDMDQSQFPSDVSPVDANGKAEPGIYDKMIPILQQWKTQYDFVGSYYINVGDTPTAADPTTTDWTTSLPYYKAILAMGGEIGNHSYTHLINPPTTTLTATTSTDTPAGSAQITLTNVPSFAGVTVGMVVNGLNLGANTPVPGVAGEGGTVANTFVTAVSGNTITLSYMPGGYGTANDGVLGDIPAGTTLSFSLPPENTNFLQTGTGTVTGAVGQPFTYDYEFNQSKLLEQQMLGVPIYGAAVPGASETLATDLNIFPYYQSVAATSTTPGYASYVTGGWTGVGSGYPNAFGYINPSTENTVYIAPNLNFDFTEIQYQGKTVAQAEADWAAQINSLTAGAAGPPILVWPIHDYGVAAWDTSDSGAASPYTTQMYTDFLANAYNAGYEFVTLEDLASRIQSFTNSNVTSSVNGNVITATVTSAHAGDFALNVAGQGSQVIENVGNWYAYNDTSVFVPESGATFSITLGASSDPVTHISSLPMRGDLLSVTGDGLNLSFSIVGDGQVGITLGAYGNRAPVVSGATIVSFSGNSLVLNMDGLGQHNVSLRMTAPPPAETVSAVAFSADTGASATDLVTNVAAQTVTGTLSAALAAGDVVQVSLDNGTTWLNATAVTGASTFSLSGVVLAGSGTVVARVANSDGVFGTALSRAYVLDTTPPAETVVVTAMTLDSGAAGDFITNNGSAGRTVSGTLSSALGTDETLRISFDAGVTWQSPTVTGTTWSLVDAASHTASWSIQAQIVDLAGNVGPLVTRAVTLDTTPPSAPSVPMLAPGSDSGVSASDNITNVKTPSFTGTAEAGATVTLFDGTKLVGTGTAAANGGWTIMAAGLADGTHSITAKATDAAGNVGAASAALAVKIDTAAPAAPTQPNLTAATDTGVSNSDNITNSANPVFTGTAEAGSTVTLLDGSTAIGTAVSSSTGAWSITAPTLIDGVHSITAKAADVAGNTSPASKALAVTIDRTAPAAPVLSSGSATSLLGLEVFSISGKGEAGDTLTLLNGTATVATVGVAAAGTWSWQFIAGSSPMTLTAVQTDKAGNRSAASGLIVTGTSGASTLSGGTGNDLFLGGAGADTFSFSGAFGKDIIADFAATGAAHDVINFHASSMLNSFTAVMSHATQVGSSVVISQDAANTVTLLNVNRSSLASADFKFV